MSHDHRSSNLDRMVERQIEARGIRDPRVLDAFRAVDRAVFVPEEQRGHAYDDRPLPIGEGQTISQPYMVARMTAELRLRGAERVLEIGTGSGYQTAILAHMGCDVYTIEFSPVLARRGRAALGGMGFDTIHYRTGDGTLGWPEAGPFDRILGAAAAPEVPPPWLEQLADPGLVLLPIGASGGQRLVTVEREGGQDRRLEFCPCSFVLMRGRHGYK